MTFTELVRRWEGACLDSIRPSPWCGCGSPHEVYCFIRDVLAEEYPFAKNSYFTSTLPAGADAVLAELLEDRLGLLEHSGSWYGAWLTPFGQEVRDLLSPMSDEDIKLAWETAAEVDHAHGCLVDGCPHCGRGRRVVRVKQDENSPVKAVCEPVLLEGDELVEVQVREVLTSNSLEALAEWALSMTFLQRGPFVGLLARTISHFGEKPWSVQEVLRRTAAGDVAPEDLEHAHEVITWMVREYVSWTPGPS